MFNLEYVNTNVNLDLNREGVQKRKHINTIQNDYWTSKT